MLRAKPARTSAGLCAGGAYGPCLKRALFGLIERKQSVRVDKSFDSLFHNHFCPYILFFCTECSIQKYALCYNESLITTFGYLRR